jgi:NTP pyrophosphatase (non-canonical NTP hydrolase)
MKHELVGNAVVIGAHGCTATCTCGWTSGARFSSSIASIMFREHVDQKEEKPMSMEKLSFPKLRAANVARCNLWHGLSTWSVMEWACAMVGEAGEAANIAKKIRRIEQGIAKRTEETMGKISMNEQKAKLAEECADTLIYLDLLAASQDIDLEEAVIKKFNQVSEAYGFPQRL